MANEIQPSWKLRLENGSLKSETQVTAGALLVDQTTAKRHSSTQTIGFAAHEALTLGDLTTPGWAHFTNLDPTNFVELGTDVSAAFAPFAKLKPGESFPLRLGTAAPYAKADTGAVELDYEIFDD